MFTLFFSVQGSLFSFPPDLLACLFIYPWLVGELSVAQLWKYTKEEYVIFQSARTGSFPVLALRSMRSLWWIFRKIETCWRGVFIKMFQDNWSISYKRDDSLGKCLVAAIKLAAEAIGAVAARSSNLLRIRTEVERYQLHLSILMWSDQYTRSLFIIINIIDHYSLQREQQTTFWTCL